MKKSSVTFTAHCQCGWESQPMPTSAQALKASKMHINDTGHKDYEDVPLFEAGQ